MKWTQYSQKLQQKIAHPRHAGPMSKSVLEEMVFTESTGALRLYLVIDRTDGVIAQARFCVAGPSVLIGIAEALCCWLTRKRIDRARRLSAELLEAQLRDHPNRIALEDSVSSYLNQAIEALEEALSGCGDVFSELEDFTDSPIAPKEGIDPIKAAQWEDASTEQRLEWIQALIASDIQPYIALDEGGVEVLELRDDFEVVIRYSGACTTCYAATGSTLNAIAQILQTHLHPQIRVTPDLTAIQLPQ